MVQDIFSTVPAERLLAEIEQVIQTAPSERTAETQPTNLVWLARAMSAIRNWNSVYSIQSDKFGEWLRGTAQPIRHAGYEGLMVLLHQAHADLRLRTVGPLNTAMGAGQVFAYFDTLRQIVEMAKIDILFTDRYFDGDFASRYLVHVTDRVKIRLLSRGKAPKLISSVEMFAKQHACEIEIRTHDQLHDRFVFIDRREAYQSGASFKDGALNSSTTLTQITDAFPAVLKTYEDMWDTGTKVFSMP